MSQPLQAAPEVLDAIRERIRALEAELAHWRKQLSRYDDRGHSQPPHIPPPAAPPEHNS